MATIAENLSTLQSIKTDIKNAIINKGGSVTDAFGGYAQAINDLPTGGGGGDTMYDYMMGNDVVISGSTTIVKNYAFGIHPSMSRLANVTPTITEVNLPNASTIGMYAFQSQTKLEKISLPNCISINNGAFMSCTNLSEIYMPKIQYIKGSAFANANISTISFNELSLVGWNAFGNCKKLKTANLPNVLEISYNAFYNCVSLEEISLQNCLTIGSYALQYCSMLSTVILPTVSYIGGKAFGNDSCLMSVYLLSSSMVSLDSYSSRTNHPFFSCRPDMKVYVPESLYASYYNNYGFYSFSTYSSGGTLSSYVYFRSILASAPTVYIEDTDGTASTPFWFDSVLSTPISAHEGFENVNFFQDAQGTIKRVEDFGCVGEPYLNYLMLEGCSFIGAYGLANCGNLNTLIIRNCTHIGEWCLNNTNIKEIYVGSYPIELPGPLPDTVTSIYINADDADSFKNDETWGEYADKFVY